MWSTPTLAVLAVERETAVRQGKRETERVRKNSVRETERSMRVRGESIRDFSVPLHNINTLKQKTQW